MAGARASFRLDPDLIARFHAAVPQKQRAAFVSAALRDKLDGAQSLDHRSPGMRAAPIGSMVAEPQPSRPLPRALAHLVRESDRQ
jgi:hypothetical protein